MNLKTVTAATMHEALAVVKRELGANAMILNTKTYRRGGIFGFGARNVVEITATDNPRMGGGARQQRDRRVAKRRSQIASRSIHKSTPTPTPTPTLTLTPTPTPTLTLTPTSRGATGDLIRRTYQAAQAEMTQNNQMLTGHQAASDRQPLAGKNAGYSQTTSQTTSQEASRSQTNFNTAAAAAEVSRSDNELAAEMATVKRLVEQMMVQQRRGQEASQIPEPLFDQYMALLKQEVAEELADDIIKDVHTRLTDEQIQDADAVRDAIIQAISSLVPVDQQAGRMMPTEDKRPRTIALVGPTGVGKTTTIAKLAATFKLKQDLNVGLITLDTYRIAAVDQLRTYADIIGLPLYVVNSPKELASAMRKCKGCDVVLIDTAGRSQRNDPRLQELQAFIDAANPHEVHLVLSSTCTQLVMLDAIERFSAIRTDRIIFTKLDEAVTFGVLVNVAKKVGKQLSYITTGQEVPHQIEPSNPQRLAQLVLGGKL